MIKKLLVSILSILILSVGLNSAFVAHADSSPGDVIVTLGADLNQQQKDAILKEMGVDPNTAQIIEVTNAEEHKYLDNYMPKAQIGTRAISSSRITLGEKGSGLSVSTNHITYVSNEMYMNALATAGVKDAEVYVTAPFDVSGTAGLTGLIKAYEIKTGDVIPEEQKQVANEEMVTTAKLADEKGIGKDKAAALMTAIKEKMADANPKTDADMEKVIKDAADQTGVKLSDKDIQDLVNLFNKMKDLDINWNQVGDQLQKAKDSLKNFLHSDEAKGFFAKLGDFLKSLFQSIGDFISSLF
ncbi:MAG: DUF1002 domain-containing protein [Tuberibacillus sp.]